MKKRFICLLAALLLLAGLAGCGGSGGSSGVPKDFSFSIAWNPYGDSTYDSETGVLIKQAVADPVEDYTAELKLTSAQKKEIWDILQALDLESYDDMVQPQNAGSPAPWLNITLRADGKTKSVYCLDLDTYRGTDDKSRAYAEAGEKIIELLTSTKAWQAMPDYQEIYW